MPAPHHDCGLCQFGRSTTRYGDYEFKSSSGSELFVPNGTIIFVAPVNIAHGISAHHYLPPAEFLDAVEACPPQGSRVFLKLFLDSGGREWVRAMERSQGGTEEP